MTRKYDFKTIESRWQDHWTALRLFSAGRRPHLPKFYALVMFPYPSGTLHVGHGRNYIIGDALARYKMMKGFDVLTPMGWDAFGLPAENAAIEAARREGQAIHPRDYTLGNVRVMKTQIGAWGVGYDWEREIASCHPGYYKWTQWLFLKLLENKLAYKKQAPVNWCPGCQTVLANEQVEEDGTCDRCSTAVVPKNLEQWYFRITRYAERLLDDLDKLEDWPERVLTMQEAWIGRSEGAEIVFRVTGTEETLKVFTTRADTLFGVTFVVVAPEHPIVAKLAARLPEGDRTRVSDFVSRCRAQKSIQRTAAGDKEGVSLGATVTHPLSGEQVALWTADYALMDFGTGAVMGVPAHDQRDFLFARKYGFPVKIVIQPQGAPLDAATMDRAFEEGGVQVRSGEFDALPNDFGRSKITAALAAKDAGGPVVTFRLRDWLISRQRYWGAPIPIVNCPNCGAVPVPEEDLPVLLPHAADFRPRGQSPLAAVTEWVNTRCPRCEDPARRETDTMDTFVDSAWYFLRYISPRSTDRIYDTEQVNHWLPVDQYIGGAEHATKHLIYSRFITKFLYDIEFADFEEPFAKLFAQGLICADAHKCPEHGWVPAAEVAEGRHSCGQTVMTELHKMSKSKRNGVGPEELIAEYGADTVRLYTLFIGPPERDAIWNTKDIIGAHRFLYRVWETVQEALPRLSPPGAGTAEGLPEEIRAVRRKVHQTIRKVTEEIEGGFKFNTAVAAVMEMVNELKRVTAWEAGGGALREACETLVLLLAPFVPHMAEELWEHLGHTGTIFERPWPAFDPAVAAEEEIEVPVQVNGKVRSRVRVPAGATDEEVRAAAMRDGKVQEALAGRVPLKVIVVPRRMVNFVIPGP
ncbi:MAG: leucine--tRNA ligase [Candidatus Brocadiae bacterium]|nr:leucine--tRNA ligase [Candidatus Brocadiia bacterium]